SELGTPAGCLKERPTIASRIGKAQKIGWLVTVIARGRQASQMLEPGARFFDLAIDLADQIGEEIDADRFGVFDSQFDFVYFRCRDFFDFGFDPGQTLFGLGYAADQ